MNDWELVLGGVPAVASITAAILSWRAGRSAIDLRESEACRAEWWRRFQWATELALSDDEYRANIGVVLLRDAAQSPLAGEAELLAVHGVLELSLSSTVDPEGAPPYTESSIEEERKPGLRSPAAAERPGIQRLPHADAIGSVSFGWAGWTSCPHAGVKYR